MTKNHLKRIGAPKTWNIMRKESAFVTKIQPGSHNKQNGVPMSVFLKDMTNLAKSTREARYILLQKNVLVNGKKISDHRFTVGLLDIITIKETQQYYRIVLSQKGKLISKEIKSDAELLIGKIINKTIIAKGKTQINLFNGVNITVDKDTYKTGDSIIYKDNKITQHFALTKTAPIFLTGGKHIGENGIVEDIMNDKLIYKNANNEKIETAKRYAFVIGKDKPIITI